MCSVVQEWQQQETNRSELEQKLRALQAEESKAAKHLEECLSRASVTQDNQAGVGAGLDGELNPWLDAGVGSLAISAAEAAASRTSYLGNVRAILTRTIVPATEQAVKGVMLCC